ncbi:MAG: hypothetical protein HY811_00735 [Planctomycetes bacterium]|nr:hypothetical protein [Planctomycetota bacterium]
MCIKFNFVLILILFAVILCAGCSPAIFYETSSLINSEWLIKETEHLTIHYKPDSYAQTDIKNAVESYENSYQAAKDKFREIGFSDVKNKINLYLVEKFNSKGADKNGNNPISGCALMGKRTVFYQYSQAVRDDSAHEIIHLFLYDINPKAPYGFQEGICRFYETRAIPDKNGEPYSCKPFRLAKLEPPDDWKAANIFVNNYTYASGNIAAAFVSFLMERLGERELYEFYRALNGKKNYKQLIQAKLNIAPDDINKLFVEYGETLENPPQIFGAIHEEWKNK